MWAKWGGEGERGGGDTPLRDRGTCSMLRMSPVGCMMMMMMMLVGVYRISERGGGGSG